MAFAADGPIDTTMAAPASRDVTALWRVGAFSHQRVPATAEYLWDNRERRPARLCVFQYTVEGVVHYRDREGEREVPPGHAVLFTFGEPSRYWLPAGPRAAYVCEWVNLQGAGLAEHWTHLRRRYGSVIPVGGDVVAELHRLMAAADPAAGRDTVQMAGAVHRFVMQLFSALTRDLAARQTPVERAIEALLTKPLQPGSLTAMARRFACSREHLCRAFVRRTGRPPAEWQAEQRVQAAVHLLRSTALTLGEVALQSGFNSVQTLSRQVRRVTGRSPRAVRGP
jgi:AraC-like DNA-binding protein